MQTSPSPRRVIYKKPSAYLTVAGTLAWRDPCGCALQGHDLGPLSVGSTSSRSVRMLADLTLSNDWPSSTVSADWELNPGADDTRDNTAEKAERSTRCHQTQAHV